MTLPASLLQVSASDPELVLRARQGDLAAYGLLMTRYRLRFGRYAFHLLGNEHDAEEALQDAFASAYRALDRCRQPDRFGAWLFRILVNRCRTTAGRRRRHEARRAPLEAADVVGVPHAADATMRRDEIARALEALVPDQREAFLLKYVEELSYDEMAAMTGAGESALKMRVKRACERLRTLLGDDA